MQHRHLLFVRFLLVNIVATALAAAACGGVAWGVERVLSPGAVALLSGIAAGVAAYLLAARLLAVPEWRELRQRFGSHAKALNDLPRRRGELAGLDGTLALMAEMPVPDNIYAYHYQPLSLQPGKPPAIPELLPEGKAGLGQCQALYQILIEGSATAEVTILYPRRQC